MRIQILELIEGAKYAEGLTVIIDVFRAFTTECYAFAGGALLSYPIGTMEEAFAMKKEDPNRILLGERGGARVEGCDLGNSPYDAEQMDFSGREIVHSTSAGTQGIVRADQAGAAPILAGALVNAKATAAYIKKRNPEHVTLVAMGNAGVSSAPEDVLCARYIRSLLLEEAGETFDLCRELEWLRHHGAEKFFDPELREIFPPEDYPLSVSVNRFPFVLLAGKEKGRLCLRRVDVCGMDPAL